MSNTSSRRDAAFAGVMHKPHGSTCAPVRKPPILKRLPAVRLVFAAGPNQRRQIIDNDYLSILNLGVDFALSVDGCEVWKPGICEISA